MMKLLPSLFLIVLLALAITGEGKALAAQQGNGVQQSTRVPVTVALLDRMPLLGSATVIQRRMNSEPQDFILLQADSANSIRLSAAVQDLLTIRRVQGDQTPADFITRVRMAEGAPGLTRRELPWAQRVINDVRRTDPQEIAGLGTVRAVKIWLPRQDNSVKTSPSR